MSLEAISRIRGVEDSMDQARAEARTKAQKLTADAERTGQALLAEGRRASAAKSAEVMQAAEAKAASQRAGILESAKRECDALAADAGAKLTQAANMIVGRVVES